MRTSKKILSFFLAVVMVVTTCSVGFTAFAKSNDNPLWKTTSVDADSAFDTLNKLADQLPSLLMGIEAISKPVYEKGAKKLGKTAAELTTKEKEQIASETTLQDLLGVLQPTLIGALAKTSQSDFVTSYIQTGMGNPEDYNYLSGSTGAIDYFSLTALCLKYKDNKDLSKDTRNQLDEWLYGKESERTVSGYNAAGQTIKFSTNSLWYLADLYAQKIKEGTDSDKVEAIAKRYTEAVKSGAVETVKLNGEAIGDTYDTATLYQLKNFDFKLTADEQAVVNNYMGTLNIKYATYGINVKLNDLADVIYYDFGVGQSFISASEFIRLISDGGATFNQTVDSTSLYQVPMTFNGFTVSDTENNVYDTVKEIARKAVAAKLGVAEDASFETLAQKEGMTTDYQIESYIEYVVGNTIETDLCKKALMNGNVDTTTSPYYTDILKGMVVRFGNNGNGVDLNKLNSEINAKLPKGYDANWQEGDSFFISDDELTQLRAFFSSVGGANATTNVVTNYFRDGEVTFNDKYADKKNKTVIVPASLKGSYTSEFWSLIAANQKKNSTNYNNLLGSFGGFAKNRSHIDKTKYLPVNSLVDASRSDPGVGINALKSDSVTNSNNYSKPLINEWVAASYNYIVTKIASEYLGVDTNDLGTDSTTYTYSYKYSFKFLLNVQLVLDDIVKKKASQTSGIVLTDAQKEILNGKNVDLTGSAGTEITNLILNNTIGDIVDPSTDIGKTVDAVLKSLLKTNVNLKDALTDVWKNLVNDPIKTVVNLLPLLTVVINELLEPILFSEIGNSQRNNQEGFLYSVIDLIEPLKNMTADTGSYIGISQLAWDLNAMLPQLMHWLQRDGKFEEFGGTYWNGGNEKTGYISESSDDTFVTKNFSAGDIIATPDYVLKYDKVVDSYGKAITYTKNSDGSYTYSYNGVSGSLADVLANVSSTTKFNVKYTYEAGVPKITGIYIADKALKYAKLSDLEGILKKAITASNGQVGAGLYELVTEIAGLFTTAVDTYVSTPKYRDQVKGHDDGGKVINSGLNNLMVAIPQLFDIMENLAADKYGVRKDAWTYCYKGKIVTDSNGAVSNSKMTEFKDFAANPNPTKIFDCFVGVFVEDWLDAILGLVNNVISSKGSEFEKNLPIITGLLNSVGGFTETSALTDLFNSIFQITRDSKYSFTFEPQSSGFVGLDRDNAYFLITNVSKLVDVVKALINSFKSNNNNNNKNNNNNNSSSPATTQAVATPNSSVDISAHKSSDMKNVDNTIAKLDKTLSSLLTDSSVNGYSINKTSNIIAGVISLLSNYIGANASNATIDLLNTYLYYLNGEDARTPNSNGNVNPKDIYTNEGLTTVVVRTYALVETLVAGLTDKYAYSYTYNNGTADVTAKYNLISEAVNGLISPDSLSVRIKDTGIKNASKKLSKLDSWSDAVNDNGTLNVSINWGITAGNRDEFMTGLSTSLRLLTSILGVVLIDTGIYENALYPVLNTIAQKTGITVDTPTKFADKSNPYRDEVFTGIVNPIVSLLDKFLEKPATTLLNLVSAIGVVLDDTTTPTLASVVSSAVKAIANELNGAANILKIKSDKLGAASPSLAALLEGIVSKTFGDLITVNDKQELGLKVKGYALSGNNIIPIINTLLAKTGIKLNNINWNKLGKTTTPAQTLVYVLDYVVEFVKTNHNLSTIIGLIMGNNKVSSGVKKLIKYIETGKLDGMGLLKIVGKLLDFTQSPTEVYWAYSKYKGTSLKFKYPDGISSYDAESAITQLDSAVDAVMALLTNFGVVDASNLKGVVSGLVFTNANLTSLAKALYGALDKKTISPYLNMAGITVSPKGVAGLLMDKSYGKTYSSAAKTLKKVKSWKKVKTINWGFKDGSAKAEQGFVHALVAILRPLNSVLNVFLNEGKIDLSNITIAKASTSLDIKGSDGKVASKIALTYELKKGVLTLTAKDSMNADSKLSTIKLDLNALNVGVNGINGYEGAIIPLLDVLQVSNSKIKTFAQYQKDCKKAKDNVLLDVLNPLMSFVDQVLDKPFETITSVLPNLAYFIDNNGIGQLLDNLLAPITNIVKTAKSAGLDVDKIISAVLGKDLGKYLTSLLKVRGVKLNIKLADLKSCNIQDIVVPLINSLLKKTGIKLPDFKWSTIAAHGKVVTSKSHAKNAEGKFTNKEVIADKGEVLVAVLRYVADTLIKNAKSIKSLVSSIGAIKKNSMLKSIISSVFTTISMAEKDDIVRAVFYFLTGEPTNAFWDYTAYKTGSFDFSYPKGVDVDFLKNLPPMLDGLVGSLVKGGLNNLIGGLLFKDDIVNSLLTGLYGAVEKVKVGDGSLVSLLAQTGIDFSTSNVAKLLTDETYGKTYAANASVIAKAGSWSKVNTSALKWGVKDRDTFFHALVAVLRPVFGVLDVLLNDAYLGLFDIVRIPGSNGYTSSIVPLMEAFSMYNVKTQYQYREDMKKAYDNVLLDIINPIWDKVEDILNAPLETLFEMLPNLALFIGNNGLCQILDNLLTPISALIDAVKPVVDLNTLLPALLKALKVDLNSLLGKIGVSNFKLDIYDINATLKPLLGADAIVPLLNNILGMIKIKGTPLGIKLNDINWLQLASHGKVITDASQAATYGTRIYVKGNSSETLIAVLSYLIETVNAGDNFKKISSLVTGLVGGNETVSGVVDQVLPVLKGDTDTVIASLVDLLQTMS